MSGKQILGKNLTNSSLGNGESPLVTHVPLSFKGPKGPQDHHARKGEEQAVWWSLAALTANLGGYRPNAPKDLFAARECGGRAAHVDIVKDF